VYTVYFYEFFNFSDLSLTGILCLFDYFYQFYAILIIMAHTSYQKDIKILSCVYGSMTNNNGFWIGWLDLLTASFTITHNHNQSSVEPFFLDCQGLTPFLFSFYVWLLMYNWTTYIVLRWTHRKHIRCPAMDICEPHTIHHFLYCYIYSTLRRNGSYPIVACVFVVAYCCRLYLATGCLLRICLHRNMFTKLLPSNGSTCVLLESW
jgi:hypothetical protein